MSCQKLFPEVETGQCSQESIPEWLSLWLPLSHWTSGQTSLPPVPFKESGPNRFLPTQAAISLQWVLLVKTDCAFPDPGDGAGPAQGRQPRGGWAHDGLTPLRRPVGEDLGCALPGPQHSKRSGGRSNQMSPKGEVNKEKAARWSAACGLSNAEHLLWISGAGCMSQGGQAALAANGRLLCVHMAASFFAATSPQPLRLTRQERAVLWAPGSLIWGSLSLSN